MRSWLARSQSGGTTVPTERTDQSPVSRHSCSTCLAADRKCFLSDLFGSAGEAPFGWKPDCDPDLPMLLWADRAIGATRVDAGMAATAAVWPNAPGAVPPRQGHTRALIIRLPCFFMAAPAFDQAASRPQSTANLVATKRNVSRQGARPVISTHRNNMLA